MLLYLVRHVHALDALDDDSRPVSPKGERQIEALAKFFARNAAFHPAEIWHSPLVRARDTARRLARSLQLKARLLETAGLRPESDPGEIMRRLQQAPEELALVGHEPHLSTLASLLVTNTTLSSVIAMEKGAVLALEGIGSHWVVRWHVMPELVA